MRDCALKNNLFLILIAALRYLHKPQMFRWSSLVTGTERLFLAHRPNWIFRKDLM